MKSSNKALHPYGAQSAPRVNADVRHKMKTTSLCAIVCAAFLLFGCRHTRQPAVTAQGDAPWDSVAFTLGLAEVRYGQGKKDRAEQLLLKAENKHPEDYRPYLALIMFYELEKAYALGAAVADRAQDSGLTHLGIIYAQAEMYAHLKDFPKAQAIYATHDPRRKEDWPSVSNWALACFETGDYAQACRLWSECLKHDPHDPQLIYSLALSYSRLGMTNRIPALLEQLRSVAPLDAKDFEQRLRLEGKEASNKAVQAIGDKSPQPDP